jgi:hypothetical protein
MDENLLAVVKEKFGKVVYSHKTHEKASERYKAYESFFDNANIILTLLILGAVFWQFGSNDWISAIVGSLLTLFQLGSLLFQKSFHPAEKTSKHKMTAIQLWVVREKFLNLINNIISSVSTSTEASQTCTQLDEDLALIYLTALPTNSEDYEKARDALKNNEEMTFSNSEINFFLPESLRS